MGRLDPQSHGMEARREMAPSATQANCLCARETHVPKDSIVTEESWMRSQGWRTSMLLALCRWHGEWESHKQTARSTGRAGVLVAAAMWHVLATPCGAVQGPRACALSLWHCSRGALLLSVYLHTGAGLIQENWRVLSLMDQ